LQVALEDIKPQMPVSPVARPRNQHEGSSVGLRQPAHMGATRVPSLVEQLQQALDVLGEALAQATREVDIEKIRDISDAIGKTAGALQVVERLK